MTNQELAKQCYELYCNSCAKYWLPWDELPPVVRESWLAVIELARTGGGAAA